MPRRIVLPLPLFLLLLPLANSQSRQLRQLERQVQSGVPVQRQPQAEPPLPPPLQQNESLAALDPKPFQCQASVDLYSAISAYTDTLPETDKFQTLPPGAKTVWPAVNVSAVAGPTTFGWVETVGKGVFRAVVNAETCVLVSARTTEGLPFDQGPRQQSFFIAILKSQDATMAGKVVYLPQQSLHQLCYTPPTPGHYLLELRLGFSNAWHIGTCLEPSNEAGFARYKSVLSSWVKVTGRGPPGWQYNASNFRVSLPPCTLAMLSEAGRSRGSEGYWDGDTWQPQACRVPQLEPQEALQCLNGKRVLMAGDSQVRILFGLMQLFLNHSSRAEFEVTMKDYPDPNGDLLKVLRLKLSSPSSALPPLDPATGQAVVGEYEFLNDTTLYYGGVYEGFSVRQVTVTESAQDGVQTAESSSVSFSLTFSSFFTAGAPLFSDWKLNGSLTGGVTVTDGGIPFDLVLIGNQIHDSSNYETTTQYLDVLTSNFLPAIQQYMNSASQLVLLGGLSAFEARKPNVLYRDNNLRLTAFERATSDFFATHKQQQGALNFIRISPLTLPRPDLATDASHFAWQVSLSMLDLWLGSICPSHSSSD